MIRLIDERIMEKLRDKPENIDLEEFMPLVGEWREDKASKAKCPYCVEPIQKQATKCNHCLSEIEWFKFDGLYGPCKAGSSEEMEATLVMARATLHAAIEAEKAKNEAKEETKFADRLSKLEKAKCYTCNKLVFSSDELQEIVESGIKRNLYKLDHSRRHNDPVRGYKCVGCTRASERRLGWFVFILLAVGVLLAAWVLEKA